MSTPVRIASALCFVADKIDASRNPSRKLVASDLQLIRLAMQGSPRPHVAENESQRKLVDILWGKPEGKDVDFDWKRAKELTDEDKLVFQLEKLQTDIGDFIKAIHGDKTNRDETKNMIKEDQASGDVMTSAPAK